MRALVTGGAGLVGSEIIDHLLNNGHEVISIDNFVAGNSINNKEAALNPRFRTIVGDILNNEVLADAFSDKIDWIFHQAVSKNTVCLVDPKKDLDVNAGGTLKLLMAAKNYGVKRFVHASTGSVYGQAKYFPTDEEHPKNPSSFYGVSKLAAESYVRLFNDFYGLPSTVLRYFHVFGSRQDSSDVGGVVPIFIRRAMCNQDIYITGDGSQVRAFTHVSDIARINLLAATSLNAEGKVFNCASDVRITIQQLAEQVLKIIPNSTSRIIYTEGRLGDIYKFDINNNKLKSELNFQFNNNFYAQLKRTYAEMYHKSN